MYFKDFDTWNTVKKRIQGEQRMVNIRKGEIRRVSFGVNVGSEIDGKGDSFARPALILHMIGSSLALIVPLSTKVKDVPGYLLFQWKDKENALCIHQMKVVSQKRILDRMGRISMKRLVASKRQFSLFIPFWNKFFCNTDYVLSLNPIAQSIMKIKTAKIADLKEGEIKHMSFSDAFIERVKNYKAAMAEVETDDLASTLESFRMDQNPEAELRVWEKVASTYQWAIVSNPGLSLAQKKDVYSILLSLTMGNRDFGNIKHLGKEKIAGIVHHFS